MSSPPWPEPPRAANFCSHSSLVESLSSAFDTLRARSSTREVLADVKPPPPPPPRPNTHTHTHPRPQILGACIRIRHLIFIAEGHCAPSLPGLTANACRHSRSSAAL